MPIGSGHEIPARAATLSEGAHLACVVGDGGQRLFGLTLDVLHARQLEKLGIVLVDRTVAEAPSSGDVLLLRGDALLDDRLVSALRDRPKTALVVDGALLAVSIRRVSAPEGIRLLQSGRWSVRDIEELGLEALGPEKLADDYVPSLRKRAAPLARIVSEDNARDVERAMFEAAYKVVTDVVTRYVWPTPAFHATRALARAGISPNTVTTGSLVFAIGVLACFLTGNFVGGVACGFAMAFLDTVDGKLARVTSTSSRLGNAFDHGIDLVAPPLWWLAYGLGLAGESGSGAVGTLVWIVVGGHVAGKLVEQAFITSFGIKIHIWRRFDSRFRLITARRNANLLVLTPFVLLGMPWAGYLAMAVWVSFCLSVHSVRYATAYAARRRDELIKSWLEA